MSPSSRRSGSVPQTLWVRTKPSDPIARARPTRSDLSGSSGLLDSRQPSSPRCPMPRIGLAVVLTLSLILAPLAGEAQEAAKVWRIGFVSPYSADFDATWRAGFRKGLRDLGYVEGKNIVIEERHFGGAL